MNVRLYSRLDISDAEPRTKHYHGFPPALTKGIDTRQEMERASFLVIEQKPDGVFLYRFDGDGECVGDTWHTTVVEAKDQASYEFGARVRTWEEIPDETEDIVTYCLERGRRGE
jgi:hypothetical protein